MSRQRLREIAGRYDYSRVAKNLEGLEEDENEKELEAAAGTIPANIVEEPDSSEDEASDGDEEELERIFREDEKSEDELENDHFELSLEAEEEAELESSSDKTIILPPMPPLSGLRYQDELENIILHYVSTSLASVGWYLNPQQIEKGEGGLRVGINKITDNQPLSSLDTTAPEESLDVVIPDDLIKEEEDTVTRPDVDKLFREGLSFTRKGNKGIIEVNSETPGWSKELLEFATTMFGNRQDQIDYILDELELLPMIKRLCIYP
ncbi:phosphoprotein [Nkolbisson virus]|uniref:Phosphoprotein n=1 Tax=Nkolbisson virus TaxID=380442 RepID=A0A0D3R1L1_9RHAB|nr:phosphoprotein [Nkolbisson virus]AJR28543.1 phosphoprotein [Nkolbisson virus]